MNNSFYNFNPSTGFGNEQKICTYCGGKGWHNEIGEESCHNCCGTGRNLQSEFNHEPCRFCNGKGRKPFCRRTRCNSCNGTGKK